jgi:hypothetical protein
MTCTRCGGTGFLNAEQIPVGELEQGHDWVLKKWWYTPEAENSDVEICDCCGDGENYWYGTPGEHYGPEDPAGKNGPYAGNGGLCKCH